MKSQSPRWHPTIDFDYNPLLPCRPNPVLIFAPVFWEGQKYYPAPGDRNALLLLRRRMPKKVSFPRAYSGWRASGAREEHELGEGRAFFRWLQKHELSIEWREKDFSPHPYFSSALAPQHDPHDEMSFGLSFAIRPVTVAKRNVKLYVQDKDMLSLINLPYGREEDFLELVMRYITQRFEWQTWKAPAPHFLDWVLSRGARPVFSEGQLGFSGALWKPRRD